MARRIDVELTSDRNDGTWTWRAAGAKQPKGVLDGALLYEGAKVGDECRVEAEAHLDGLEVTQVFAPKKSNDFGNLLEMKTRELRDDELVTEVRAPRGRGGRDGGRDGGRRGGRDGGRGGRDGGRGGRDGGGGRGEGGRNRRPEADAKPRPKRLRARRVHRDAILATVADEHRPIADQVMQGGIPAVRSAIEKQNAEAKAEGKPEIPVETVLSIAEPLVSKLRSAEWHDRADAALADIDELDLRDLRSVVVAADAGARTEETRAIAEQLKTALNERIEKDHAEWMADLEAAVKEGRTVRALKLSSRPVKAGSPLPPELARTLADGASAGLAADVVQDRWATVLEAVAFSPIRSAVTPAGIPTEPKEELLEAVRRVADRVPEIAALFGIDPSEAAKAKKRRPNRRKGAKAPAKGDGRKGDSKSEKPKSEKPKDAKPKADAPKDEAPAVEAAAVEAAEPEAPAVETPEVEATAAPEAAAPEAAAAEAPAPESEAPAAEAPAEELTEVEDSPAEAAEAAPVEAAASEEE